MREIHEELGHLRSIKSSIFRRLRTRTVLVCLVIAASLVPPQANALSGTKLRYVRDWGPASSAIATFIPHDSARRIIMILNSPTLKIAVADEHGKELGRLDLDPYVVGKGLGADPVVYVFDDSRGRISLIAYGSINDRLIPQRPHLVVIDVSNPRKPARLSDRELVVPPGVRLLGLSTASKAGVETFYFVGQAPSNGQFTARVFGTVVGTFNQAGSGTILPSNLTTVPNCQRVIAVTQPAAIAFVDGLAWIACGPTAALSNSAPYPAAIQAVTLPADIAPSSPTVPSVAKSRSYFLPGTYAQGESFFDARAGADGRMLVAGSGLFRAGQAVWVFDLKHRAFVGQVAADLTDSVGVDRSNGRIYMGIGNAVLIGSDNGIPLPQALPPVKGITTFDGQMTVVPFKRSIILPIVRHREEGAVYAEYQDLTTESDLPAGRLTDFSVEDRQEASVSTPDFTANAQAFGMRLHLIGGATNPAVNRGLQSSKNWWYEPLLTDSPHKITALEDGDRDVYFARVRGVELSADGASAGSSSADRDDRTDVDYKSLMEGGPFREEDQIRRVWPVDDALGSDWPAGEARCLDFGSGGSEAKGTNSSWAQTWDVPTVSCDLAGGKSAATAQAAVVKIEGIISIGGADAHTAISRNKAGKVHAVSTAEARDITIGGVVHIGRAVSEVNVDAFGGFVDGQKRTPGKAIATYRRTFENVVAPGFTCPVDCDPTVVAAEISNVLGSPFQVELPSFERSATRGGAHAHVWRDPWLLVQDSFVNGQLITETQVPALRITYIADGDVPSRLLIDLAATKADATAIKLTTEQLDSGAPNQRPVSSLPNVGPLPKASLVPARTSKPATGLVPGLTRTIRTGWDLLFGKGLGGFSLSVLLWALFAMPPFLAVRRKHLKAVGRIGLRL